jgi:AraC-like DNA-binding protein
MAEIARRTGFTDASYFGKVFRRRTGATPRAIRRQHTHIPFSTVLHHGAPRIEEMQE